MIMFSTYLDMRVYSYKFLYKFVQLDNQINFQLIFVYKLKIKLNKNTISKLYQKKYLYYINH